MPRRPASITKAELGRTIDVLHAKGYSVAGVKPDGTLLCEQRGKAEMQTSLVPVEVDDDPYSVAATGSRHATKAEKRHDRAS